MYRSMFELPVPLYICVLIHFTVISFHSFLRLQPNRRLLTTSDLFAHSNNQPRAYKTISTFA